MSVMTYIKQGAFATVALGVFAAGAHTQTARTPASAPSQSAVAGDSQATAAADQAEWQRDTERWQKDLKAQTEVIRARARELQREVAKEMAENGVTNRADLDKLTARLYAQRAGLAAETQEAVAQAQQLFAQTPGLLDASEDTGWLGVEIAEVTPEKAKELKLNRPEGVIVSEVLPDSPSAKAGLEAKDVILEYDGQAVEGTVQFRRLVRETPPGRSVAIEVSRNGQNEKLNVQVGNNARNMESRLREALPEHNFNFKFNTPEIFPNMTPVLGVQAEDVSGQLGTYFHVPGGEGVLVREVTAGSPAAKAGMKAGDIITHVDGAAIKTVDDLREHLREERKQKNISLTVVRQGSEMKIAVTIEAPAERPARTRAAAL
ncbi:MAG TPA: PDZ domain-containing protein [Candidatus Acidoferrales bacterium]|nr:PDZ domain-containing protein [Candidatus Acidoferrales bacterium]